MPTIYQQETFEMIFLNELEVVKRFSGISLHTDRLTKMQRR